MMPLRISITAANTVSRAKPEVDSPPASIIVTISATSIAVTASASTMVPKGSPTLCAITSAWCTAAITLPNRPITSSSSISGMPGASIASSRVAMPTAGAA